MVIESDGITVNLNLTIPGLADCASASSSDQIAFGPGDYNIVFTPNGCICFSTNTRVYPFGTVLYLSSRKTAAKPDYRVVESAVALKLADNITGAKFVGVAADEYH